MLDEPTRGIDIHAKNELYKLILQLAEAGLSIIIASSELPEILALCNRILVITEGNITATFAAADATEDNILKAAIPKRPDQWKQLSIIKLPAVPCEVSIAYRIVPALCCHQPAIR